MRLLSDDRLYVDTAYCLQWLQKLEVPPRERGEQPLICHFYWRGEVTPKVTFAIKSFLATQDLERTELWLWLDGGDCGPVPADSPLLRPLRPFIEVRRFDPARLAEDLPVDGVTVLADQSGAAARSDVFRVLVLYRHGGIYADVDTMFLRDLHALPWKTEEFCYRWSANLPWATHAVSSLRKGSSTARALVRRSAELGSWLPWHVLQFEGTEDIDLLVLPCVVFDPLWPHNDKLDRYGASPLRTFDDFFREWGWRFRRRRGVESHQEFFAGAFAYQWHNRWAAAERARSYFGFFDREFDLMLADKLGIELN